MAPERVSRATAAVDLADQPDEDRTPLLGDELRSRVINECEAVNRQGVLHVRGRLALARP